MLPETNPKKSTAGKRKRKKEEQTRPEKKRRTTYVTMDNFKKSLETKFKSTIDGSIKQIFDEIEDFHEYDMEGSQQAETRWEKKTYTTKLNMHSEMGALEAMLEKKYKFSGGVICRKKDDEQATKEVYSTTEPHCGFCTLFLQLLGLPLGKPTKGRYGYASHNNYPLPKKLKENKDFLDHFLQYKTKEKSVEDVMKLVTNKTGDISWVSFREKGYLDAVWGYIFERINNYLPKSKKRKRSTQ